MGGNRRAMRQKLADRSPFFYGWWILGAAGTANFARNAAASLTISVFILPALGGVGVESDVDCGRGCGWGFGSDVYVAGDWPDDRQVWCAGRY